MDPHVILSFRRIIKRELTGRSYRDRRRIVRRIIAEYAGSDGEIYRKSFEGWRDEWPTIPLTCDHQQAAAEKHQWADTPGTTDEDEDEPDPDEEGCIACDEDDCRDCD